jgi:hypothetical protein
MGMNRTRFRSYLIIYYIFLVDTIAGRETFCSDEVLSDVEELEKTGSCQGGRVDACSVSRTRRESRLNCPAGDALAERHGPESLL